MRSAANRNVSILVAGFCLLGFFPFYALGFIGSDSGPVEPVVTSVETMPGVGGSKLIDARPVAERDPILDKFSPEDGWSQARRNEIKLRMIRGENPSTEEREFFLGFAKWSAAMEKERVKQ